MWRIIISVLVIFVLLGCDNSTERIAVNKRRYEEAREIIQKSLSNTKEAFESVKKDKIVNVINDRELIVVIFDSGKILKVKLSRNIDGDWLEAEVR